MKKSQSVLCDAVLFMCMLFAGCASTEVSADSGVDAPSLAPVKPVAALATALYKGEGMTVAVLSPEFSGGTNDGWIPQSLQDNLTGLFALYSKMSVLDRKNEAVVVAEQTLSESGFYSEENAVQIGRMTNAQYIAVGSVQKTGGVYACNFRVNEVETNEIKAAAVGRYPLSALENGTAVKEIARQLLSGLSIELSGAELERLTQKDDAEVKSVTMLAKGDAANKAEKYIEALSFYNQVGGSHKNEAAQSSRAMLAGSFDMSSLKERISYQQRQVEKWNKIFHELEAYMLDHALIAVYDFSVMEDKINAGNNTVNISVTPGIKIFPDRNALSVWKTVLDEWIAVYS
ncbi:MAG: CsgG/HfaB family protein, partial [Treponemataceae bacterium]|nr:CsgG/HfaB family protein [Treponemataceae bacterium]